MSTREQIQQHERLSAQQMDRVLERASTLQERARGAGPSGHTLGEIKKVGAELDIDAAFVDQALREVRAEEERAAQAARARGRLARTAGLAAAGVMAGVLALGGVGSMAVRSAAEGAEAARAAVETVVRRQAALVPQLLALSGGDVTGLAEHQRAVEDAPDLAAQVRAADALQLAMARALGQLPPAQNEAQSQQRLSLQHELVGATNRVSTERRRHEQAVVVWRQAARAPLGRLAVALGMAPPPPAH